MYFGIQKIIFDSDTHTEQERKELKALCEKLRARFKVCASAYPVHKQTLSSIAVTALAPSEQQVNQLFDDISSFCESSGFARILEEHALIDDVDLLEEDLEEES